MTVIGDELQKSGASVVVDRPLIVNGLQTSHVIDLAARQQKLVPERASDGIVVRILESDDEVARDKIIASTNNQTKVPSSALYASQPEQREIERFLAMHDWYYERRKNLYRNRGS
ncbi:AIPR family protein [Curtobacterium sp. MCPF17_052]|uniref:AIPR family protein n=1 Tax=Curtobacterium sp. MCPF17_052 TaxID=2175655 RepID=UPI0024E037D9|nr:AIPR family protein [Curtobacterium sp. MCPF17_052]WIB12304.1 AIPR family protein [Curtobacterium sp. MCPF17_052]